MDPTGQLRGSRSRGVQTLDPLASYATAGELTDQACDAD